MSNVIATSADNPWISLWRELANAEWVADIGLPLAVALVALLFAYRSLRTQIANDRELSRAEYRAATARVLGTSLNQLVRVFDTTAPKAPWWGNAKWDGFSGVSRAVDEAEISLGNHEALHHVLDIAREISHSWQASYELRKEQLAGADPPSIVSLDNALVDTLNPALNRFREAIAALMRWDGYLPVPVPPSPGDWKVPLPVHEHRREYKDWQQRIQDDYRARVQRFEDRSQANRPRR